MTTDRERFESTLDPRRICSSQTHREVEVRYGAKGTTDGVACPLCLARQEQASLASVAANEQAQVERLLVTEREKVARFEAAAKDVSTLVDSLRSELAALQAVRAAAEDVADAADYELNEGTLLPALRRVLREVPR